MPKLRIFFATDLHASEKCYRKFLNAARVYEAEVLILGGDITGKMVVPIVEGEGHWKTRFMGVDTDIKSAKDVSDMQVSIKDAGYYPYLTNMKEMEELNASPTAVKELFMKLMLEQVDRWVRLAEERLGSSKVKMFITGGNDDPMGIEPVLSSSKFVINPENQTVDLGLGFQMVSSGYGNITPWKCPRDVEEDVLLQKIEDVIAKVGDPRRAVFNLHVPPYDSGLDFAPQLDADLKPVATPGMGLMMVPVGSKSVRTVIEKYQPMLGLHGHIHESRGSIKVGKTVCINPGSEYGEGILRGAIIDLNENGVKSFVLTTG